MSRNKPIHRQGEKHKRGKASSRAGESEKSNSPWPSAPPKRSEQFKENPGSVYGKRSKPEKEPPHRTKKAGGDSPYGRTAGRGTGRNEGRGRSEDKFSGKVKVDENKTWIGTVSAHPDGFGSVNVQGRSEDVFLPVEEMRDVMHGDKVEVRTINRRGREAGVFVRMVEHAPSEMTAQFKIEHGMGFAHPRSKRMQQAILIHRDGANGANSGDWVRVKIRRGTNPLRGDIVEVLGDVITPKGLVDLIVAEVGLSETFPPDVMAETAVISEKVRAKDKLDRLDLTHLPFVTIDGADARDFDDAICVSARGDGFEAWVAIADVAHYVEEDTALDKEALSRGNSFYFPDRVIPMLPEKLSNGLCSLNPHLDRLVMAVRMRFDAGGKRRSARVYNAVIHSQARLTYEQAALWLEKNDKKAVPDTHIQEMLKTTEGLYRMLVRNRAKRGALEIDAPEVRAMIDGDKISSIETRERNTAHKLIEEMMLAANTAVSKMLEDKNITQLYRVHPAPEREAIEKLNAFLGAFGLKIRHAKGEEVKPGDVQQALHASEGKPFAQVLHRLVLRSMQQAKYTTENVGHFGLAYESYGHFTSPIRRYADLTTHRRLKSMLAGTRATKQDLEAVGSHISTQERVQQRAEWDTQAMLAALYHKKDIGEEMEATVSGVSKRRVFCAFKSTLAEASLDVDAMGSSFDLDDVHHRLTSKNGTLSIGIGDQVVVKVVATDPVRGFIEVVLVPKKVVEASKD